MLSLFLFALLAAPSFAGPACQNGAKLLQRNRLSCGNKQYLIDYHNKIRNYVASGAIESQPKAADMIELRWSEDLAKVAQKRADTCLFEHGDLELNSERIGQNLAIVYTTSKELKLNITYMMELWYNEVFLYGYKEGFEPNSGHYSQLIWGKTSELGCGYSFFKEGDWYKMYLVCDYYPPGNWIGEKPYVYGKRNCKEYGLHDSVRYNKLCAVESKVSNICKLESHYNESDVSSNAGSSEENAIDMNSTVNNETSVDSGETFNSPNGDDEFVTASYDELDASVDSNEATSDSAEFTADNTTLACNESSSTECLQHVGPDEATNNASVESAEHHCSKMSAVYNKTEEDIRRIHWNLEILKKIFTLKDKAPEKQIESGGSDRNETTEESTESTIFSDDPGNYTLNMIEESLQLAEQLLKFMANNITS